MFFSSALALNVLCASKCVPGGFLGIPPAHGRSIQVTFTGNGSPNNNLLIYSLTWPPSCPNNGVHRPLGVCH